MWWFKHGLAGFAAVTAVWGLAVIVYDSIIEACFGNQFTISAQTQAISVNNPPVA